MMNRSRTSRKRCGHASSDMLLPNMLFTFIFLYNGSRVPYKGVINQEFFSEVRKFYISLIITKLIKKGLLLLAAVGGK